MADRISIEVDTREVQEALKGTSLAIDKIEKKAVGIVLKGTLKAVRSEYRKTLRPANSIRYERTGALYKSFRISNKGSYGNVYPRAVSNGRNWAMGLACILNYGAKNGIKPRGFIQKGEQYASSGAYSTEIDKMVDKELDKYWS